MAPFPQFHGAAADERRAAEGAQSAEGLGSGPGFDDRPAAGDQCRRRFGHPAVLKRSTLLFVMLLLSWIVPFTAPLPSCNVPPLIVVGPVKLLLEASINVPTPNLPKPPVPPIGV